MKRRVKRKLEKLVSGELTASISFAFLWVFYGYNLEWAEPYVTDMPSIFAFFVLEFILLQGSLYWYLLLLCVKRGEDSRLTESQLRLFCFFKRVNLILLGFGFAVFIMQMIVSSPQVYWFAFIYVFAAVEYVNYYHVRLSYQSPEELKELFRQKRLRSSKLAKEMKPERAV